MPTDYIRKRKALDPCPIELAFRLVGGKWKARALYLLTLRPFHFAELQRALGDVSQQVLSTQLRDMQQDGLISWREAADQPRIAGFYDATAKGRSLVAALSPLMDWGVAELAREGLHWAPPQG